jgi:acetyltransferase-like isoleucine patch superfamily enzyme
MRSNPIRKLTTFLDVNGWYVLMLELKERLASRMRSGGYSNYFNSRQFHIGERPYIRGMKYIKVGDNFCAGRNLWIEAIREYAGVTHTPRIVIGDNVGLSDSVHIAATTSVVLCDGVLVGSRVLITDHNHGIYRGEGQSTPDSLPSARPLTSGCEVLIGRNVWIGDGVIVLPGSIIGDGSVIGANSIVNGNIPSACIAVGSPARPVSSYDTECREWRKWSQNK